MVRSKKGEGWSKQIADSKLKTQNPKLETLNFKL
jgi:hypothetical protein